MLENSLSSSFPLTCNTITYLPDQGRVDHVNSHINKAIPYNKIFPAVDGEDDEQILNKIDELKVTWPQGLTLRRGVLGIVLSHLSLWKSISESSQEYNIILEDDAVICDDFLNIIPPLLDELPFTYDILYLFLHPNSRQKHRNFDKFNIVSKEFIDRSIGTWGGVAYILSPKGAGILYNFLRSMKRQPWDYLIQNMIKAKMVKAYMPKGASSLVDTLGFYLNPDRLKKDLSKKDYEEEVSRACLGTHNWPSQEVNLDLFQHFPT